MTQPPVVRLSYRSLRFRSDLRLPLRGYVVLWSLVALLVGISVVELAAHRRRTEEVVSPATRERES